MHQAIEARGGDDVVETNLRVGSGKVAWDVMRERRETWTRDELSMASSTYISVGRMVYLTASLTIHPLARYQSWRRDALPVDTGTASFYAVLVAHS